MTVCAFVRVDKSYRSDFLFRRTPVLQDITFSVEEGETLAYLGHNGAGKTTSIKALLGLIRIERGRITVFGQPAGRRDVLARVGYLPENPYFYDHLTGRELLQLVSDLHGLPRSKARSRQEKVLEMVSMAEKADLRLRTYSKGMLQRIGLAQAIVADPELLILDEPMGGLDPVGRYQIRNIISDLKAQGTTIFLSSHILSDVESIADRAAILSAGRLRRIVDLRDLPRDRRRMEVQCKHVPGDLAQQLTRAGLEIEERGEAHHILVPRQRDLPDLLRTLDESGARLLQVTPRRASLEDIFLAEVEGVRPGERPRRGSSATEPRSPEAERPSPAPARSDPAGREPVADVHDAAEVLT